MILGMPTAMFLIFAATLIGGSVGATHYVIVHVLMGKPVAGNIRTGGPEEEVR
jgi:hypothetical protein